jgi:hypothetical protein
MADAEHLEILSQGATIWNDWRREHFGVTPDLGHQERTGQQLGVFDLRGADLSGANLRHTDFMYANLINADLREADLVGANLSFANLEGADLSLASLDGALLEETKLNHVNFHGAMFVGTHLTRCELNGVVFTKALMGYTTLVELDLRKAIGLETVSHMAASDISISTIYSSEGNIPEPFLLGCGVAESFIVQIPALVAAMQPIQFYSCFISYSSKDEELAQRLHADLQSRGVRCWFAPEDLKIGERFRRRIDEVIRVHDKLLLILSEHSVASPWVEKEVETAMEREDEQKRTVLFPVRLDDSVMEIKDGWPADVRRTRHIGDFRRWKEHDEYQKAFARLLADLKASA